MKKEFDKETIIIRKKRKANVILFSKLKQSEVR